MGLQYGSGAVLYAFCETHSVESIGALELPEFSANEPYFEKDPRRVLGPNTCDALVTCEDCAETLVIGLKGEGRVSFLA